MATNPLGAPFVETEGDSVLTKWDRISIVIPESYFAEPPLAEDLGGSVEVLAFVDVRAYEKPSDTKPVVFGIRLPARVRFRYNSTDTDVDGDGEKLRLFNSNAGDVLIEDINVVQSSDNVTALFRVMASARITGVSYTDLSKMFIEGAKLNGAKTGVPPVILEAIVAEMARWTDDVTVPLRVKLAEGKATENDFRFLKLKELPRLNSVFTGLGFEDIQLAIQTGIRKTRSGEPQRTSPMERLIKL